MDAGSKYIPFLSPITAVVPRSFRAGLPCGRESVSSEDETRNGFIHAWNFSPAPWAHSTSIFSGSKPGSLPLQEYFYHGKSFDGYIASAKARTWTKTVFSFISAILRNISFAAPRNFSSP